MIFRYDELKEAVQEDFSRFYRMGFGETQIFPAVLDEYRHGEEFCAAEDACVHVPLALCYAGKGLNFGPILEKLRPFLEEASQRGLKPNWRRNT